MNEADLVKDLRLGIIKKQQEIKDHQAIIDKLTRPVTQPSPVNTNVLAIGDTPRSSVTAYCQSAGRGMPIDITVKSPKEGFQWSLLFTSDSVVYLSNGIEIPGGVAMTAVETMVKTVAAGSTYQ